MGRRRRDPGIDGHAVVDKPAGMTSHDVVAAARRALGTPKVGHSGTLDPDATGVLVLGVGKGTRLLRFGEGFAKCYEAEIVFGVETSTLDAAGEITAEHDMTGLTPARVLDAARAFVGEIDQVPPMVSAVRVDGRRLHELAREGIEVERAARRVTVHAFDLEPVPDEPLVYRAVVRASAGTYVRSLAADLGTRLGGGAHLRSLRRTAVGPFTVEDSDPLDAITLRPLGGLVAHLDSVVVDADLEVRVRQGQVLDRHALLDPASPVEGIGPYAVVSSDGTLLAVYEAQGPGRVKPAVVVAR